ncbi:hypothetical protein [Enterovibrio norvegicus]|uniref:hypothetical protein n=1 Tax=Enterovibrio norvegicus TaxID=188144 RepID=UPI0003070DD7|nr:hypothetical protein [Enterovibrio norvegicus]OEF57949.1 hypothetical protein A1OU_07010 [Enterovibrio norvegicus]
MKKIILVAILATLATGCSQRVIDYTVGSTKNVNLNGGEFIEGERVEGDDTKPIILFPLGIPSIKEATDNAIETDKCAVGLNNIVADFEFFSFLVGFQKYKVEGNLLIDRSQPGCEDWTK